jgi:very-short-patch-repair endonuclease
MPGVDARMSALAARQHGVVSTAQLTALGLGRHAIAHRVATGRLTRLHRGVYRVGPISHPLTSPMAATLACGPTAVLSHHSAAALLNIRKPQPGPIDVTVTTGQSRMRDGIRVHRTRTLESHEVTRHHGIPTTTAARTLLDLATRLNARDLTRAVEEAQVQRHLDEAALAEAVERAGRRPGAAALKAALMTESKLTRSEAERRLLELIRAAELPEPRTNARVGGYEVDVLFPGDRLVVEVDGFAFHGGRHAFERDRRKDAHLTAEGFRVVRVTWRQLAGTPEAVVATLARSLSAGRGPARPLAAVAPLGSRRDPRRW